ncbi:MAG TPA: magnesium transporter, partial [Thermaerobacter sp.]
PNQAARLKAWLPAEYRQRLQTLMTFPENTAGSLATIDYIAAREGWTVQQALDHVRKVGHDAEVVSYIYVVDARGRLVSVASLRELILADPRAPLSSVGRKDVISVRATADQEEAARILSRYDFVALPVVDDHDRLIGTITVDDIVDVIHQEATEDIQRLGGSAPLAESYFKTPVWLLFRKRVGWLLVLFVAGAYTGTVLRHFEETLSQVVALAFFIPLLIGTGGNTGSQTVATLVRALAVGEVTFRDILRVLGRELATGALLGTVMAAAAYVRAFTMGVGFELGPVVALSALFIVVWASTVAAVLPLVLHRLGVDPAVVSGPFITTLVDGTGLFIYFTIARLLLQAG